MEQQAINQAIDLFQIRFGITPQESRYPVIVLLFMAAGCQHNTPFLCGRQISKT